MKSSGVKHEEDFVCHQPYGHGRNSESFGMNGRLRRAEYTPLFRMPFAARSNITAIPLMCMDFTARIMRLRYLHLSFSQGRPAADSARAMP